MNAFKFLKPAWWALHLSALVFFFWLGHAMVFPVK